MHLCVCVYICAHSLYMLAGKLLFMLLLPHCVCRWWVCFSSWKLVRQWVCVCVSELPGASAAVAYWDCGCRCYIWQSLGSCHPLCPSEAEGSSPSGCWKRNVSMSCLCLCTAISNDIHDFTYPNDLSSKYFKLLPFWKHYGCIYLIFCPALEINTIWWATMQGICTFSQQVLQMCVINDS